MTAMTYRHLDGNEYLIQIADGQVNVSEIVELPGSKFKGLAKVENAYDHDTVWYTLFEDLIALSGKSHDEIMEFFGVTS